MKNFVYFLRGYKIYRQNVLKHWEHLRIVLQFSMCNCISLGLGRERLLGMISEVTARV